MQTFHQIVKNNVAITHLKLTEALTELEAADHPDITSIERSIALTLHLQKLLVRLGATLPKQGLQK